MVDITGAFSRSMIDDDRKDAIIVCVLCWHILYVVKLQHLCVKLALDRGGVQATTSAS